MKKYLKQFFRAFKRTPALTTPRPSAAERLRIHTPEEIQAGLLRALAEHSPAAPGPGFVDRWRNPPTPASGRDDDPLEGDMYISGDLSSVLKARRRKHMGDA